MLRLLRELVLLLGVITLAATPAVADGILADYGLVDLSGGTAQRQHYVAPDGTLVDASQDPWSNSAYYYVSYLVDGSQTWNPVTGVWKPYGSPSAGSYSDHGFLGSTAVVTTITFTFPTARRVDLARFYSSGYAGYYGTDYGLESWNGTGWESVVARQTLAGGSSAADPFYDHLVGRTSTKLRVTLYDGGYPGQYVGDIPTFGEIQFFQSTATVPEPSGLLAGGAAALALALRTRRLRPR